MFLLHLFDTRQVGQTTQSQEPEHHYSRRENAWLYATVTTKTSRDTSCAEQCILEDCYIKNIIGFMGATPVFVKRGMAM